MAVVLCVSEVDPSLHRGRLLKSENQYKENGQPTHESYFGPRSRVEGRKEVQQRISRIPTSSNLLPRPRRQFISSMYAPAMPVAFGPAILIRTTTMSDEELDSMLPTDGFDVHDRSSRYDPTRKRSQNSKPASAGPARERVDKFVMWESESGKVFGKQSPAGETSAIVPQPTINDSQCHDGQHSGVITFSEASSAVSGTTLDRSSVSILFPWQISNLNTLFIHKLQGYFQQQWETMARWTQSMHLGLKGCLSLFTRRSQSS